MPNQTETSSSNEPDPDSATPRWRQRLARLWDSGIPLWQKLLVWAGAAGVAWTTWIGLAVVWGHESPTRHFESIPPALDPIFFLWCAISLALSAGLWIWPVTSGRWRTVALVLAVPATIEFVALSPLVAFMVDATFSGIAPTPHGIFLFGLGVILPLLVYPALLVLWVRAVRDFFAWRRARRIRQTG